MERWPLRRPGALRPAPEALGTESRELSHTGGMLTMFGLGSDVVLLIAVMVGWVVLMRIILPRLGVST